MIGHAPRECQHHRPLSGLYLHLDLDVSFSFGKRLITVVNGTRNLPVTCLPSGRCSGINCSARSIHLAN
jgi:hypothetical protein